MRCRVGRCNEGNEEKHRSGSVNTDLEFCAQFELFDK